MKAREFVMRFRIELLGISPPIWRRIDVPGECSFWDLHVAVQDAMGWTDSHLHIFYVLNRDVSIGFPDDEFPETVAGWETPVREFLSEGLPLAVYEYDFGDSWIHEVRFEGDLQTEPGMRYPRCVAGARKCPPEDCGGVHGYAEFVEAVRKRSHPEHRAMLEWVGGEFDPDAFPSEVRFHDPSDRLRQVLNDE